FLESMADKATGTVAPNPEDELVKATLLTHGGRVVHPAFAGAEAAGKPIVPGQNKGDDPATGEPAPAAKARSARSRKVVPGQNKGDDPATGPAAAGKKAPVRKAKGGA